MLVTPDDSKSRAMKDILSHETGHEYVSVETKSEAEEAIESGQYAGVLITSLRIHPGHGFSRQEYCGTGLAVIRCAKEKGLPVIVISGADEKVKKRALEMGVDRFIKKVTFEDEYVPIAKEVFGC
mgnify:CR=1 FL=1